MVVGQGSLDNPGSSWHWALKSILNIIGGGSEERSRLLGGAKAVLCPLLLEPFGGVNVGPTLRDTSNYSD